VSFILRSFSWQAGQQVARGLLGMLVASATARTFGERGLGVLDSSFALVNLLAGCAGLGMQRIVTRELCGESGLQSKVKGSALVLSLASCTLAAAAANGIVWAAPLEERLVVFAASLLLFVQPFGYLISSFFEAIGRMDLVGKVLLGGLIISAGARLWCVKVKADLPWMALAYTADFAVSCTAAWLIAARRFPEWLKGWKPDKSTAKAILSESLPLLLSSIAAFIYISLDMLMLKWMRGYEETGLYGAAIRISQIPLFVPGILAGAFTARLMASYNSSGEFSRSDLALLSRLLAALGFTVLAGGWLLGPFAVHILYGDAFAPSGGILRVHVVGVFFMILGSMRNHLLILERKGNLVLLCDVCGAVTNLALNLWLIPEYGAMGASWATAVAYFVSFFLINFAHPDLRKYSKSMLSAFSRKLPLQPV
jgi:PST family polysaccharide transporter